MREARVGLVDGSVLRAPAPGACLVVRSLAREFVFFSILIFIGRALV